MSTANPVAATNHKLNYIKYVRQQQAMGEDPVSYEEFIGSQ
jgi:hypothetical protein